MAAAPPGADTSASPATTTAVGTPPAGSTHAQGDFGPPVDAAASPTEPETGTGPGRSRVPIVAGVVAALVVVAAVVVVGQGDDGRDATTVAIPETSTTAASSGVDSDARVEPASQSGAPASTRPTTTRPAATTTTTEGLPPSLSLYQGTQFDVGVPAGWGVKRVEEPVRGAAFPTEDSTWIRDGAEVAIVRLDVTFGRSDNDPVAASSAVRNELSGRQSYVELGYESTTLLTAGGSYPAVRWEYLLDHPSQPVLTHNVNYFLDAGDRSVALLTRAPADEFDGYARLFDDVRASLVLR